MKPKIIPLLAAVLVTATSSDLITNRRVDSATSVVAAARTSMTGVHLRTTQYQFGNHEWCVAMRVYWDDGTPAPSNNNYTWYKDGQYWSAGGSGNSVESFDEEFEPTLVTVNFKVLYYVPIGDFYYWTPEIPIGCSPGGNPDPQGCPDPNGTYYTFGSAPPCIF